MATTAEPRFRKRVPCKVQLSGGAYSGMVINVSRGGLFVQTTAGPGPGEPVRVELMAARKDAIAIAAHVVWRRVVLPHLRTVSHGGLGLRIRTAPDSYYRFLSNVAVPGEAQAEPAADPSAAQAGSPQTEFRVRLKQEGGPRTRSVTLCCPSEPAARSLALAQVGSGWTVLGVEEA